jgi:hypothetical protein
MIADDKPPSLLIFNCRNHRFSGVWAADCGRYNFPMSDQGTMLYRPVGQKELDLIAATAFTAFPPRLEGQPIFYPVLNEEYASFIAREWNTVDAASGYVGYVLCFAVNSAYLSRFDVQKVGSASALEYWIPAEQLDEFNSNIIGKIELISTVRREDH